MPKKPPETRMTPLEVATDYADMFAPSIDDLMAIHAGEYARGLVTDRVGHEGVARSLVNRLITERVSAGVVPPIVEYVLSLSLDRRPRPQDVEEALVQLVAMAAQRWGYDRGDFVIQQTIERIRRLRKDNPHAD